MTNGVARLSAAKLWLISEPPDPGARDAPRDVAYLAQALYALVPVLSEEVDSMSGDEWWRVYVNPTWLDGATIPEVGAELAHVCWHLLLDHADRARDLDVDRSTAGAWHQAADAAVAHVLDGEGLRPERVRTARDLGLTPRFSAEQYYATISRLPATARGGAHKDPAPDSDRPDQRCGSGADGIPRAHEFGQDADLGAVSRFEASEIRRSVALDYQGRATRRGTDPGDALRWVRDVLHPRAPWEQLLTRAVRRAIGWTAGRGDFTYSRPSRRAANLPGIVLPGQHRPVPRVSIVVDTSASVDDVMLAQALGEIDGAIAALAVPGSHVAVYSVDAAVHAVTKVRRAGDAVLVGAGGTDLRIGVEAAASARPRPDVVIVLTDGDTPWPATPPPGCVVIAALLGRDEASLPPTPPWAVRVECVMGDRSGL